MSELEYYVEYNINTARLGEWEIEVLSHFKEASKIISKIYKKQRDGSRPGAGFYPEDATKEEILEASKSDPLILHQFTVVKRNKDGKLHAVMYYDEYQEDINRIVDYIKQAEALYRDNNKEEYAEYLKQLAIDFKSKDGFGSSSLLWLKIEDRTGVDIKIGPIETYLDKLFAVKRAYQSNLRIENTDDTASVSRIIDTVKALQPNLPFENSDEFRLNVRMDSVVAMAGWHAELTPRGSNYPVDPKIIKEEKVAKILIYSNNIEKRDGSLFDEILPALLDPKNIGDLDRAVFMKNWLRFIINHELTEELAKYKHHNYEKRLGAYSEVVRELYSTLMGIKAASVQVLKGALSVGDYKYFLIELILVSFRDWVISVNGNTGLKSYSDGYVWCINYLFEIGALTLNDNKDAMTIDFSKIYIGIDQLTTDLSYFMLEGEESAVKEKIIKYSDVKVFEMFRKRIEEIVSKS